MALPLLSILKAIAPLIAASSGIAGSLNERVSHSRDMASDERIKKLEEDLLKMSRVLAASVEQLQAAAQELRAQSELSQSLNARIRTLTIVSVVAIGASVVALILTFA